MIPLMDALNLPLKQDYRTLDGPHPHAHPHPHSPRGGWRRQRLGAASRGACSRRRGLTREVLLSLDPYLVARSLTLFHRAVLDQCPTNIAAEFILGVGAGASTSAKADADDDYTPDPAGAVRAPVRQRRPAALAHEARAAPDPRRRGRGVASTAPVDTAAALRRHARQPPRLACTTLGGPRRWRGRRSAHVDDDDNVAHARALGAHLRVGAHRRAVPHGGRRGVVARGGPRRCARAPSRGLTRAWKRVNLQAVAAIEAWARHAADALPAGGGGGGAGGVGVAPPQVTPWGGDVKVRACDELARAHVESGDAMVQVDSVARSRVLFDEFRKGFLLCPRKTYVAENEVSDDMRRMVAFWREIAAEGGGMSSLAVKMQRYVRFVLSLCESHIL